MRSFVVGAAGFLGSHLVDALLTRGDEVVALDNMLTGSRDNLSDHPHLRFINGNLSYLERYTNDMPRPDAIFHLATPASPEAYWKYPLETAEANSLGTIHLLRYAKLCGATLLYTSSSEVYGNAQMVPQPENYWGNVNPMGVRAIYDEGKRFSEALIASAVRRGEVKAMVVRLFNTYGPRLSPMDGRAVPTFIRQAIAHETMTVHAPGTQTRSFCYVSDTIEGILAANAYGGEELVFNIGNPEETSVLMLAEMINRLCGDHCLINIVDGRQEEIARRVPDITRAKTLLGWQPTVGLVQGLDTTISWYQERM